MEILLLPKLRRRKEEKKAFADDPEAEAQSCTCRVVHHFDKTFQGGEMYDGRGIGSLGMPVVVRKMG